MQRVVDILLPDRFIIILLAIVAVAAVLPASGTQLELLSTVSTICIVTLFFVHGARLSRSAVIGGFARIRLHIIIIGFTFLAFPVLGLLLTSVAAPLVDPSFVPGILFLCALPTTVASSIAMVSMARGNVAASVIAAAFSSMLGVVLTPLMFAALLSTSGAPIDVTGIGTVVMILAVPFAIGHLCRPLVGGWIETRPAIGRMLDRLTILLAIYVALSAAVGGGLLAGLGLPRFLGLLGAMLALLLLVILAALLVARVLRFDYGDGTALLFAAMQKSVISGTPMARILFPGAEAGLIIVPLLVYYVPMMTVSAVMAARMGAARE